MSTYDEFIQKAIAVAIPASAPASDRIQYYGQVGDFFGGFWGTVIGAITVLAVLATWHSTRQIDKRSKTYQVFAEILRTHEEIVTSLRLGAHSGREAFSVFLSEFYAAYSELQELESEQGRFLSIRERIDVAYHLMYYGAHPETIKVLSQVHPNVDAPLLCDRIYRRRKSNLMRTAMTQLSLQIDGDPADRALWHQAIRDGFEIVKSGSLSRQEKEHLRSILSKAQTRPHNQIDKHKLVALIETHSISTEFGGHQNRLSHYLRNLHGAFVFIDEQALSPMEKDSLAKVLRAKLSNYEVAVLALSALSHEGVGWTNAGLLARFSPIGDLPKHFFSFDDGFDLEQSFPDVAFAWRRTPLRRLLRIGGLEVGWNSTKEKRAPQAVR